MLPSTFQTVGILPVGALGAAFYYHLTRGCTENQAQVQFIERRGSTNNVALAQHGTLTIAGDGQVHSIPTSSICRPDLVTCGKTGWLPDVLLVCTQPDQLLQVVGDYVQLLEQLHHAQGLESAISRLPIMILSSNGIYHERVRRFLVELLEESMLYGRLPDLWNDWMGLIVGKLIRGVTVQTGYREGSGTNAVFCAGASARTTLAGGEPGKRRRCAELLQSLGGWFEDASSEPPVRVEFNKALVNLWSNLLGQLKAINEYGEFRLLRIREIFTDSEGAELRELSSHLFAIGQAVRAYRPDEDFDRLHDTTLQLSKSAGDHFPSSLKWIESQLIAGTLIPQLTPTEKWLLDPLVHYARTAGLEDAADYFSSLRIRIEQKLALAIERRTAFRAEAS
jgi:ketopantoate reductase